MDLTTPAELVDELKIQASHLPSIQLSDRSECDLGLLATGAFSPLDRQHAEIVLDTVNRTAEENARTILDCLIEKGSVRGDAGLKSAASA